MASGGRRFEWDPEKRRLNLQKHGLDFADARLVLEGLTWTFEDVREGYGERREVAYGFLEHVIVTIAFTESDDGAIRIISMRKATRHEQRRFLRNIPD